MSAQPAQPAPAKAKSKLRATATAFQFNFALGPSTPAPANVAPTPTPTPAAAVVVPQPAPTQAPAAKKKSTLKYTPGKEWKPSQSAAPFMPTGASSALLLQAAEAKRKKDDEDKQKAEEQARAEAETKAEAERQATEAAATQEAAAEPTGPFRYDRDFLMAFELTCKAMTPAVEDILKQYPVLKLPEGKSWRDSRVKGHGFSGRGPPKGRGPPSQHPAQRGPNSPGGRGGRGRNPRDNRNMMGNRGNSNNYPMRNIEVKALDFGENRYVVKKDVAPDEKLVRQVRSLMGKLTPEKFEPLLKQFLAVEIGTIPRLRDVVDIVFNTALAEPNFSPTYAELCKRLDSELKETYSETDEEGNAQDITFTRLLLSQLKDEFAAGLKEKTEEEIEADAKLSEEELALKNLKEKQRRRGMIRFIGELFLRDLIKKAVIHACFGDLLDVENPDEDNIEELCRLLATVGKKITKSKSTPTEETLTKMLQLVEEGRITNSRIRFLIQDTEELKKRNWVARIKKAEAKKLSEIHAEAGGAAQTSREDRSRKIKDERRREFDRKNNRGPVGRGRGPGRKTMDGFTVASNKKGRRPAPSPRPDGGNLQLPRGFITKDMRRAAEEEKRKKAQRPSGGAFAGLMDDSEEEENSDKDSDEERSQEEVEEVVAEPATPTKSRDEVFAEIKSFVDEYMGVGDMAEATLCAKALGTSEYNHNIVFMGMTLSLEKKEREQKRIEELFVNFYDAKTLTADHIRTGFDEMMVEVVDAMIFIDYPRIWDIVGQYFAALHKRGAIGLSFLTAERTPSFDDLKKTKPKLFLGILKALKAVAESEDEFTATVRTSENFTFGALGLTAEILEGAGLSCLATLL